MDGEHKLAPTDIVELNPTYMFRWEELEQSYLLLYPEGIVKLNGSAAEIMKRCVGARAVSDIVAELIAAFDGADIEADIYAFLEVADDKDWIRIKP